MLLYLVIILLALPFLDLYILIQAADFIGIVPTLGLILATGLIGAAILKREMERVGRKLFTSVTAREISRNMLEGFLLLVGGIMLLTPGFLTDFTGFLLLVRPLRVKLMLRIEEKLENSSNVSVQVGTI
ncbi:MAG: FxsA family protein [Candidatus Nanohaloarchaea archaeon]